MPLITFGKFGKKIDKDNDKKLFLEKLNILFRLVTCGKQFDSDYPDITNELEIVKPLKEILKRREKSWFLQAAHQASFNQLLKPMGLSYETLTNKEKEEVLDMDFTFENWGKKSQELLISYIERSKNICPRVVWFCFDDIFFAISVRIYKHSEFTLNNFIGFIRDYFILDEGKSLFERYRDPEKFNGMQRKVINIYPKLKEDYGMNRTFEKFLSFFDDYNDYNNKKLKKILDDYYNKKSNEPNDDEIINLKDKEN